MKYDAGSSSPSLVHIQLKGVAAGVPSTKNQKVKGMNVLRSDVKGKLEALTFMFHAATAHSQPHFEKDEKVFMIVLCAVRKGTFDDDNLVTTLRDWLEPRYIRQKDRGWGIGVVPNDRTITSFGIKKTIDSHFSDVTEIFLWRESDVRFRLTSFLAGLTGRLI